jgi:hypothetical protein
MLRVENNGQDIVSTNYFETDWARGGYVFLSMNAGAFRLLLPPVQEPELLEMEKSSYIVVSRGPWEEMKNRDAVEILFEDGSSSPYCLHIGIEQVDVLPDRRRDDLIFSVWTAKGKSLERPGRFRKTKRIPWLKKW